MSLHSGKIPVRILPIVLEIAVLWPHLMRDVQDVPTLQGRTGIRAH